MVVLFLIIKILAVVIGAFLILARLFVFERTQDIINNKLENLWIRVDDFEPYALSKHHTFLQIISGWMTAGLDRVFGPKLISLRSLTSSVCYAIATFLAAVSLLLRYGQGHWDTDYFWMIALYVVVATAPLLFSYLPSRSIRKKYILIWLTWCLTTAGFTIVRPAYELWKMVYFSPVRYLHSFILIIFLCIILALSFYALFIGLIRKSLRAIIKSSSIIKTAGISMLNLAPVFGVYGIFKLLVFKLDHSYLSAEMDVKDPAIIQSILSSWSNRLDLFLVFLLITFFLFEVIFVLTAAVFTLLSVMLILHKIFWPALSRVLYASQRFKVVNNGNVLIYVGVVLILLGIGKASWLKALF